jgi:pantothenate kinase
MPDPQATEDWGTIRADIDHLREQSQGRRVLLGIAGAPGSGKTTLAARLHQELGSQLAVVVPMDGFHLARNVIAGTALERRRGAIDTFDGWGFAALVERIASQADHTIYAPEFRRGLEEPIACSIAIAPTVPIVIIEGNYLLADERPWRDIRDHLTETWFVESDEDERVDRLARRHVEHGMDQVSARSWATTVDAANARFIEATRHRADRIIRW